MMGKVWAIARARGGPVLLVLLAACATSATAQDYPNRPVRLVAAAIGGGIDLGARLIGQALSVSLGQQFVVDNRGGTNVAPLTVAKATPDGYTLLVHNNTVWLSPLIEPVPYDHEKELQPITLTSRAPNLLVVHPSLNVNSVKELIAAAKANPGGIHYASGPVGAANHLAAELFNALAGVNLVRVGYKGGGPAVLDLVSGQVKVMFGTTGAVATHVKSGRLRGLAVSSAAPSALAPGLPTIAQSGLPGYEAEALYGIWAPMKTSRAIINRLNQDVVRYLKLPETRERFFNAGIETVGSSPEEFASVIKSESVRMGKVIATVGIGAKR